MESKGLVTEVGAHFRQYATWPFYHRLDIKLLEVGGIERALVDLDGILTVEGRGRTAIVVIEGAENYAQYVEGGERDLENVAKIASEIFAPRADEPTQSPGTIPQVTAEEIRVNLGLEGTDWMRILRVLDRYAGVLISGGTRGDEAATWAFGASDAAPYFSDVRTWADFEQAQRRWEETNRLRAERERRRMTRGQTDSYDADEVQQASAVLDQILLRVSQLETLTAEQLQQIAQEIREVKEDLSTLTRKQANRSVWGLLWKLSEFGVKVSDIVSLIHLGSKLLPPG